MSPLDLKGSLWWHLGCFGGCWVGCWAHVNHLESTLMSFVVFICRAYCGSKCYVEYVQCTRGFAYVYAWGNCKVFPAMYIEPIVFCFEYVTSVLKNRKIRYSLRHWVASWVKVLISWCWPKPTVEMVFRLGSHLVVPISRVASRCWMMSQAWQVENLDDFSNNKIDTASRSFELN